MSIYSDAGGYGSVPISGEILFSIQYDNIAGVFDVHVSKAKNIAVAPYGRKRLLRFKLTWSNAPRKSQESKNCFSTPMVLPSLASGSAISLTNTEPQPKISVLPSKQKR